MFVSGHTLAPGTKCLTKFQTAERPGGQASPCFSPAPAAGQAAAAASAWTQPLLSAPRGSEECPPPDPAPAPWSWSAPGSSCSAGPREVCAAGSWPVAAEGPGSGCGDGGAEQEPPSSAAEGQETPHSEGT